MIKKIIVKSSTFIVVLIYFIGVIIFGEAHPFSKFPMYNSFANWSYVFYITDNNDSLIPCKKLHTTGGKLGHNFYAICNKKNIGYGDGLESNLELKKIGFEMMQSNNEKKTLTVTITDKQFSAKNAASNGYFLRKLLFFTYLTYLVINYIKIKIPFWFQNEIIL